MYFSCSHSLVLCSLPLLLSVISPNLCTNSRTQKSLERSFLRHFKTSLISYPLFIVFEIYGKMLKFYHIVFLSVQSWINFFCLIKWIYFLNFPFQLRGILTYKAVSYTHLDVYKRQNRCPPWPLSLSMTYFQRERERTLSEREIREGWLHLL